MKSNSAGPRELYVATTSSDRCGVPFVFSAPTVIAKGELPGDSMPPITGVPSGVFPRLPAAATTTMPAFTARSTASHSGSSSAGSNTGWPSDRLMTRIPYLSRLSTAQSTARMTSLTWPEPSAAKTFKFTRFAPGATPA